MRWMLVVCKRCAWAIGRRRRSREGYQVAADERAGEEAAIVAREGGLGPAELIERYEDTARVIELIEQLKPDERTALILLGLGCTYKEIGELRGWSATKVRRCISEGRARVREMGERGDEMRQPEPLALMEVLRPITFTDALVRLQGMIGSQVKVIVNHYGHFFGCGFEGELECVQTLPPDDIAVRLVVGAGGGLFLDPGCVDAFIGGGGAGEGQGCLEFHLSGGAAVTIEAA